MDPHRAWSEFSYIFMVGIYLHDTLDGSEIPKKPPEMYETFQRKGFIYYCMSTDAGFLNHQQYFYPNSRIFPYGLLPIQVVVICRILKGQIHRKYIRLREGAAVDSIDQI